MNIGIDLSELEDVVNPKFYPRLKVKDRWLVEYGGAGSGKSHFAAQKYLLRTAYSMEAGVKQKIYAFRKTSPAARRSIFPLFKYYIAEWGFDRLVKDINRTEMVITFLDGSEIICSGLDDPEKLKSVEGMTSAWMEEATEFKKEDFLQLNLRLRGELGTYKQIIPTFNPISKFLPPYELFFEKPLKGTNVHQSTVDDNRFIDAEYFDILDGLAEQDKVLHDVYRRGIWGVLKDLIYDNWDTVDDLPARFEDLLFGVDYGFNNPSCFGEIRFRDNEVYIKEHIYLSGLTNTKLTDLILDCLPKDRVCLIYCDSAEPARIQEQNDICRQRGIKNVYFLPTDKGKNSVKDGIDFCKRFKIHVTNDSVNGIKEMGSYKWREDKDGNVIDEPVKFMDHFCDMFRGAIYTHRKDRAVYRAEDLSFAY